MTIGCRIETYVTCDKCGSMYTFENGEHNDATLSANEILKLKKEGWLYKENGIFTMICCPDCLRKLTKNKEDEKSDN